MIVRVVGSKIDDRAYELLKKRAEEEGLSVSGLLRKIIYLYLGIEGREAEAHGRAEDFPVEQDASGENETEMLRKKMEELETKIRSLTKAIHDLTAQQEKQQVTTEQKTRRTMLDVIKDRKVQLLSEINPRNTTRFLDKAHKYGIVVLEGMKDVALVDPGFWKEFVNEWLNKIPYNPEKWQDLPQHVRKLADFMRTNALIYYDNRAGRWKMVR